jgi:spermidine synthase
VNAESETPDSTRASTALLVATALASLALLSLEVLQVRVFSYAIDPLRVHAAISIALLGLGAGAVIASTRPSVVQHAPSLFAAGAIAIPLTHMVFAKVSPSIASGDAGAAVLFALMSLPYLLAGAAKGALIAKHSSDAGRLFSADLLGSAVGCVLPVPLLRPVGAEALLALSAALLALAGVVVARRSKIAIAALVVALGFAPFAAKALPFAPDPTDLYGIARAALARAYPGRDAAAYTPVREFAQWDPISRAEVYAFPGEFGRINGTMPMRLFAQDGGAGSILLGVAGQPEVSRSIFEATIFAGAYFPRESPRRDVLVIGLGGAPDILSARYHQARRIVGVEVNRTTIDLVRGPYASLMDAPYSDPRVTIVHADGRGFVERTHDGYDALVMTGADTYAAAQSGAFLFSESYLYTREAFARYFQVLRPDGVLCITRAGAEGLRTLTTMIEALRARGIEHPERHIIVMQQGIAVQIIASPSPFTRDDSLRVARALQRGRALPRVNIPVYEAMGFGISTPMLLHYAPDLFAAPNDPHAIMLVAASRGVDRALVDRNPLDISPVSDDRPFFFQFLDLRRWSTTGGETIYARGLRTYTTDSIAIAVVALLMVLAPLRKRASDGPDESSRDSRAFSLREAVWAVALGSAYLGVELVLIQRATLYLGHPTWAVAATLLALLLASSAGAAWVGRAQKPAVASRSGAMIAGLIALVMAVALPTVLRALSTDSLALRVLAFVLCVAPMGVAMGVPFAGGLRATKGASNVAWTLAVNALAGVLAALAVPVGAMAFGFRTVAVCAALLYFVAASVTPKE